MGILKRQLAEEQEIEEPRWKWPFIYGFILVIVLVFLAIKFYEIDRRQKVAGLDKLARETRILFCDEQGTKRGGELQKAWESQVTEKNLAFAGPIANLSFDSSQAYYAQHCEYAKSYVGAAKTADYDDRKVVVYKAIAEFKKAVEENATMIQNNELVSATRCLDAYAQAEAFEIQLGRTNEFASQARVFMSQGSWDFCAFYSQQAVNALYGLLPTPTFAPP